jgi:predicted ABC-type sugar transport system permease subunit
MPVLSVYGGMGRISICFDLLWVFALVRVVPLLCIALIVLRRMSFVLRRVTLHKFVHAASRVSPIQRFPSLNAWALLHYVIMGVFDSSIHPLRFGPSSGLFSDS